MTQPALAFEPEVITEAQGVAARELTIVERATVLRIADADSALEAGSLLTTIRARRKEIEEAFGPMKAAAHRAHKEACALLAKADEPWALAEADVKAEIARYDAECERVRREQERQAAEERRRQEEEARRAAAVEQARLQREEEERRLAVAEIAESVGDAEGAARIIDETPIVAAPPIAPVMPEPIAVAPPAKVPGAAVRKVYRYEISDPRAIKREYLCADEKKIAQVVKALGLEAVAAIGGIRVYEERQVAGRAR